MTDIESNKLAHAAFNAMVSLSKSEDISFNESAREQILSSLDKLMKDNFNKIAERKIATLKKQIEDLELQIRQAGTTKKESKLLKTTSIIKEDRIDTPHKTLAEICSNALRKDDTKEIKIFKNDDDIKLIIDREYMHPNESITVNPKTLACTVTIKTNSGKIIRRSHSLDYVRSQCAMSGKVKYTKPCVRMDTVHEDCSFAHVRPSKDITSKGLIVLLDANRRVGIHKRDYTIPIDVAQTIIFDEIKSQQLKITTVLGDVTMNMSTLFAEDLLTKYIAGLYINYFDVNDPKYAKLLQHNIIRKLRDLPVDVVAPKITLKDIPVVLKSSSDA